MYLITLPSRIKRKRINMFEANKLSGVVTHDLSGLSATMEVANETDRVDAEDTG
jgi:hypothetical protein